MFDENKLKHSLAVAYAAAQEIQMLLDGDDPEKTALSDAAFVMGLLHDIGYLKIDDGKDISQHPRLSLEMLDNFLSYANPARKAIRGHGHSDCSDLLSYALNKADLSVDSHGVRKPMELRIREIEEKHPRTNHAKSAREQYLKVLEAEKHLKSERNDQNAE